MIKILERLARLSEKKRYYSLYISSTEINSPNAEEAYKLMLNAARSMSLTVEPQTVGTYIYGTKANLDYIIFKGKKFLATKEVSPAILSTVSIADITNNFSISSKFKGDTKEFLVECILGVPDNNFINEAMSYLKSHDWANQKGSDSKVENIKKQVENAIFKKKQKLDYRASKYNLTRRIKTKTLRFDPTENDIRVESVRSNTSLIALLNAKLPLAVKVNMGLPRLRNRTGRLAESARITSIDKTEKDFLRISYTYQRSPYDVFDRQLGRSPWNIPSRDPKLLMEASIRDLAKNIIKERFYVRRAQ